MRSTSLNIMQFNIEYGGDGVDFSSVGKAIREAGADVVAIQEGCGKMAKIATDLGWPFYDARTQVVSKYPLLNPPSSIGGAILVEVTPSKVLAVINVHPPSRAYGPTLLARGIELKRVLRKERRVRLSALLPSLEAAKQMMLQEIPVVLLGDFNAPSHRDWVEETIGLRDHVCCAVAWPTSVAAEEADLVDVYRCIYPDPVTHPGLTWPADRPFVKGYNPGRAGRAADRIDLMYSSSDARPTSVKLLGEAGSDMTDMVVEPWPTDHRAIVASFAVELGSVPTLISVAKQLVEAGRDLEIRYSAIDADALEIALVPTGGSRAEAVLVERLAAGRFGAWTSSTENLDSGAFDVVLIAADGRELARTPLWIVKPGTPPGITSGKQVYLVGEDIELTWNFAPGNRADWVCVYRRGEDPQTSRRLQWTYTGAAVVGSAILGKHLWPRRWPLAAGEYTAHLMLDDLQISLAAADFTVRSS
jgi:endonuclease/exonuclease/phosphatase family metal-dependent hydrolase